MPRTKRGLKKAHSKLGDTIKLSKFTLVVNRQKGLCWYCSEKMGADCTREHLLSQCLGGTNTYPPGNLKAVHGECNVAVGHLSVENKYLLREIAHAEGRTEMYHVAKQLRRAEARAAFRKRKNKPK